MQRPFAIPLSEQTPEAWSLGPRGARVPGLEGIPAGVGQVPGGSLHHVGLSHMLFLDLCPVSWPRRFLLLLTEVFEVG